MRSFYLFRRAGGVYYVRFHDPLTNKAFSVKSTRETDYDAAMKRAYEMLLHLNTLKPADTPVTRFKAFLKSTNITVTELSEMKLVLDSYLGITSSTFSMPAQAAVQQPAEIKTTKTPLLSYITNFWNYDSSDYVRDKLAHGQRITQRYCYEQTNLIKYWREYFKKDATLEDLTTNDMRGFEKYLQTRHQDTTLKNSNGKPIKELSTTTMNNIIKCGSIPFGWAMKLGTISSNPVDGLTAYSNRNKRRGILSPEEARELFKNGTWADPKVKLANKVAMMTGLRLGEIQGLRMCDIGDDRLYIRHSWSPIDGLKCPKNTKERKVPLLPSVRDELLALCRDNPHRNAFAEKDGFIFWGTLPDKPIVSNQITDGLRDALESIGITKEMRKDRNLVFHSWRHFYATTIANDVDEKHAQMILGHETPAMTKYYADHQRNKDFETMIKATETIFTELLA